MKTFARQKLRYDMGAGFMSIATLAAALTAASDKIAGTLGISGIWPVVLGVPLVLFIVWLLGFILDRLGFAHAYQDELNQRNTKLMTVLDQHPHEDPERDRAPNP